MPPKKPDAKAAKGKDAGKKGGKSAQAFRRPDSRRIVKALLDLPAAPERVGPFVDSLPEWDLDDIAKEYWRYDKPFEDTASLPELPPGLARECSDWKRPSQFMAPVAEDGSVGAPPRMLYVVKRPEGFEPFNDSAEIEELLEASAAPSDDKKKKDEKKAPPKEDKKAKGKKAEEEVQEDRPPTPPPPKPDVPEPPFEAPRRLICPLIKRAVDGTPAADGQTEGATDHPADQGTTEDVEDEELRLLASTLSVISESLMDSTYVSNPPNGSFLWGNIYPKGPDGFPVYNPYGKYAVRLHAFGKWRKIIIDDRIPVNAQNVPLLVRSELRWELWPLLLSKALLKLASGYFPTTEAGRAETALLYHSALTGAVPEAASLTHVISWRFLKARLATLTSTVCVPASPSLFFETMQREEDEQIAVAEAAKASALEAMQTRINNAQEALDHLLAVEEKERRRRRKQMKKKQSKSGSTSPASREGQEADGNNEETAEEAAEALRSSAEVEAAKQAVVNAQKDLELARQEEDAKIEALRGAARIGWGQCDAGAVGLWTVVGVRETDNRGVLIGFKRNLMRWRPSADELVLLEKDYSEIKAIEEADRLRRAAQEEARLAAEAAAEGAEGGAHPPPAAAPTPAPVKRSPSNASMSSASSISSSMRSGGGATEEATHKAFLPKGPPIHEDARLFNCIWLPLAHVDRHTSKAYIFHNPSSLESELVVHDLPPVAGGEHDWSPMMPKIIQVSNAQDHGAVVAVQLSTELRPSHLRIEKIEWAVPPATPLPPPHPTFHLSAERCAGQTFTVPPGSHLYRLFLPGQGRAGGSATLRLASEEQVKIGEEVEELPSRDLFVTDFDGDYAEQTDDFSYFVLLKQVLEVEEVASIHLQLFLSDPLVRPFVQLHVYDNDVVLAAAASTVPAPAAAATEGEEAAQPASAAQHTRAGLLRDKPALAAVVPIHSLHPAPLTVVPNQHGYTIVADCVSSAPIKEGYWRLRLVSPTALPTLQAPLMCRSAQTFEDLYQHNYFRYMFRYFIDAKEPTSASVHTNTFIPTRIRLQIFDNGNLLAEAIGRDLVTIPHFEMLPSTPESQHKYCVVGTALSYERPPAVAAAVADEGDEAAAAGSKEKGKKEAGKKGDKRAPSGTDVEDYSDPFWTLQVLSVKPIEAVEDQERIDQQNALKASWENGAAGRAVKAKTSRDTYVEAGGSVAVPEERGWELEEADVALIAKVERGQQNAARFSAPKPPSAAVVPPLPLRGSPMLLTKEEQQAQLESQEQSIQAAKQRAEALAEKREAEKTRRQEELAAAEAALLASRENIPPVNADAAAKRAAYVRMVKERYEAKMEAERIAREEEERRLAEEEDRRIEAEGGKKKAPPKGKKK